MADDGRESGARGSHVLIWVAYDARAARVSWVVLGRVRLVGFGGFDGLVGFNRFVRFVLIRKGTRRSIARQARERNRRGPLLGPLCAARANPVDGCRLPPRAGAATCPQARHRSRYPNSKLVGSDGAAAGVPVSISRICLARSSGSADSTGGSLSVSTPPGTVFRCASRSASPRACLAGRSRHRARAP